MLLYWYEMNVLCEQYKEDFMFCPAGLSLKMIHTVE